MCYQIESSCIIKQSVLCEKMQDRLNSNVLLIHMLQYSLILDTRWIEPKIQWNPLLENYKSKDEECLLEALVWPGSGN